VNECYTRAEYRVSLYVFILENLKAKDNLGDLDIDGKIILNRILRKWVVRI
jgi:hypothetical protein